MMCFEFGDRRTENMGGAALARSRIVLAGLALLAAATGASDCLGQSVVVTSPPNDIVVHYGNPLEILCVVERPYNSSQLNFTVQVDEPAKTKSQVTSLARYNTSIVNETTAKLWIEKPERQVLTVKCTLQTQSPKECWNKIVVDTKPAEVRDFKCRSYDLQYLNCSWVAPDPYINTKYILQYEIYGQMIGNCSQNHSGNIYWCIFYNYRNQEDNFMFHLTSTSQLGNRTQVFSVPHYANVIPAKPENLKKSNLSTHSVRLEWKVSKDMADFGKRLDTKIQYQARSVDTLQLWTKANTSEGKVKTDNLNYSYDLDELQYAYWNYDVRIQMKSSEAPDSPEFWSEFGAITFKTKGERPPFPPRTEIGAFESTNINMSTRSIKVYWQQLDQFYYSGENFIYNVTIFDGTNAILLSNKSNPVEFTSSLQAINVSITSANVHGESSEKSYIYIPAQASFPILPLPTKVTKIGYGNKTYDLRWESPINSTDGYTIFWFSNSDLEYNTGKLNFIKLGKDVTSHRVTVSDDKTYSFAISANKNNESRGLVHANCSLPHDNPTNKVDELTRGRAGPRTVELRWVLRCSFKQGDVLGYRISYWPSNCTDNHDNASVTSYNSSDCLKSIDVMNANKTSLDVTGLKPYTVYSFRVAVVYKKNMGRDSDTVEDTTLEDAPSQPTHSSITNITSSSVVVYWNPPISLNGHLREYKIWFYKADKSLFDKEFEKTVVKNGTDLAIGRQNKTVTELQPYTVYTVYMQACTIECSDRVEVGSFRTAIGAPGKIDKPTMNGTHFEWSAPSVPGGDVHSYEIEILDSENKVIRTFNSRLLVKEDMPDCNALSNHSALYYRVRAVNNDSEIDHGARAISGNVTVREERRPQRWLAGEWSDSANLQCVVKIEKDNEDLWFFLKFMFGAALVAMSIFSLHKAYHVFDKMRNIMPEFPPGIRQKEGDSQCLGVCPCPAQPRMEKRNSDQKSLLHHQPNDESDSIETNESTVSVPSTEDSHEKEAEKSEDSSEGLQLQEFPTPEPVHSVKKTETGYVYQADFLAKPDTRDKAVECDEDSPSSNYIQRAPWRPLSDRAPHPAAGSSPPPQPTRHIDDGLSKLALEDSECPIEGKYIKSEARKECRSRVPGSSYVPHSDIFNKHLKNVSRGCGGGGEPAAPDDKLSSLAYSRFAWSTDPHARTNLDLLLDKNTQSSSLTH